MTAILITDDETNPNCLRIHVNGGQWCKVYGWDTKEAQYKADKIKYALKLLFISEKLCSY